MTVSPLTYLFIHLSFHAYFDNKPPLESIEAVDSMFYCSFVVELAGVQCSLLVFLTDPLLKSYSLLLVIECRIYVPCNYRDKDYILYQI